MRERLLTQLLHLALPAGCPVIVDEIYNPNLATRAGKDLSDDLKY